MWTVDSLLSRSDRPYSAGQTESTTRRSRLTDALHVFVLASFAVAQPAYDRLGQRASFLVDSDVTPTAVFVVMALLSIALPGAIVLAEQCAALCGRKMYEAAHGLVVFILCVVVALPACKRLDLLVRSEVSFALALASGVAGVWSYSTSRRTRAVVTLATPGVFVFPGTLLFGSSVTGMLLTPQPIRVDRWSPVPVVMVVFDEFCGASLMTIDRQIDADRFPNFARLADQSTWFRNATTVFEETRLAVPAILSGRYPAKTVWSPLPTDLPQNLFSILESTGDYETAVFEPVSNLAPGHRESADRRRPDLCRQVVLTLDALSRVLLFHVIPTGYGARLPEIPLHWFGIRSSEKVDRVGRRGVFRYAWDDDRSHQWRHFLQCLEPTPDSALYFSHLVIPHISWCYLPSGRRYVSDHDGSDLLNLHSHNELLVCWGDDELLVEQQQLRYMLQLQHVDRLIGDLMARLRETGLYDRCLLIVTADHGVSFRPDQPRRHASRANQADILSVPLFVKRPSQVTGEVSDRPVESVDILPTIADVLGINLRNSVDGRSVFDDSLSSRSAATFFEFDKEHQTIERVAIPTAVVAESDFPELTYRRFHESRNSEGLFRIGPIPDLVGRTVESLPQSSTNPVEIELLRYGDVYEDSTAAIVPCYYEGLVVSPKPEDRQEPLAIAVNGTVRAVTRTYRLNGLRNRWAAMVPESSFRVGGNDVRFFSVSGSENNWRLSPCVVRASGH